MRRPGVVDLARPAAARADDVVVVGRLTADVGVLAGRQVEPFDGTELLEDLERAEHRGAPDARGVCVRASATSSAAVKWPSWSAMSAASDRRGSVRR